MLDALRHWRQARSVERPKTLLLVGARLERSERRVVCRGGHGEEPTEGAKQPPPGRATLALPSRHPGHLPVQHNEARPVCPSLEPARRRVVIGLTPECLEPPERGFERVRPRRGPAGASDSGGPTEPAYGR